MAFPVVQGSAQSAASGTSHAVDLPTSIVAGERLVVFFLTAELRTVDTPAGWTKVEDYAQNGLRLVSYSKVAVGSDSLTVTTSGTTNSVHTSYRIATDGGIEIGGQNTATSVTSIDPGSLTPSWGSGKHLWFAVCGLGENRTITANPTNFSSNQEEQSIGTIPAIRIRSVSYNEETSTQNPSSFTFSGITDPITFVVGIEAQTPLFGNFTLIENSHSVIQPAIDFAANASFPIISNDHSVIQPNAVVSKKAVWTEPTKSTDNWTNKNI